MIKLERSFTPLFFRPANVALLTQKYIDDDSHVWQHSEVKDSLMFLSDNKCAYCEVVLGEKSTYLEVEHFKDKSTYQDDVIEWENLLPSCRHCNGSKSTHDVVSEPIVNPFITVPSDHIYLKNYRLYGRTVMGTLTIEVLNLNDRKQLVKPRCEAGTVISEKLEQSLELLREYVQSPTTRTTRKKNRLIGFIRGLLKECQKDALFSAVSATILHSSWEYDEIRQGLINLNLWDGGLINLHRSSKILVLPDAA